MELDSLRQEPILIIGAGSIGERHIGILQTLGFKNIHVLRKRLLPLRDIREDSINVVTDWQAIDKIKPFACIICSPTSLHWEQLAQCVSSGMHVLVEKPVSHEVFELSAITETLKSVRELHIQVAYMVRYHPAMQWIKQRIVEGTYGSLLHISSYWGEYLPNWHPWEDYRAGYAARKELGGGVALTLSHDVDLMYWLVGASLQGYKNSFQGLSPLEVDVESSADIILEFSNGVQTNSHMNFFERSSRRVYRLCLEEASLEYDYYTNNLSIENGDKAENKLFDNFERNQMFTAQTIDFLKKCRNPNSQESLKNIQDGMMITKICT